MYNNEDVQIIKCVDCGSDFELTSGEVEFYKGKGLSLPKRCKKCRAAKKARNQQQGDGGRFNEPRGGFRRNNDYGEY